MWARPVEDGNRPPFFAAPVYVGDLRSKEPVGLFPDLMRRAVIHTECLRAAPNVHTERLPGERLLEDALTKVAREEQGVGSGASERGEKSKLRNADVLSFVHDRSIEGRRTVGLSIRKRLEHSRLGHDRFFKPARTCSKIVHSTARRASGRRVRRPSR